MKAVVRYTISDTKETKEELFTTRPEAVEYERSLKELYGDMVATEILKAPKPEKKKAEKKESV